MGSGGGGRARVLGFRGLKAGVSAPQERRCKRGGGYRWVANHKRVVAVGEQPSRESFARETSEEGF